ncbi:MAG: hypothetical protein ACFKPT_12045 [Gloeotrichia echinulata GP01]
MTQPESSDTEPEIKLVSHNTSAVDADRPAFTILVETERILDAEFSFS